ncbi:MAG TPA: FAD-dependent oxidoreductase [Solirubrobacteraceae bacterium]|jgi:NADPH-dependent 2,4-dienoyl-CoA reductase/sulfur reductase-like enzyme|nr:FAD-dependent oxidoreductase [Solirubrobacteraceae bacterium]
MAQRLAIIGGDAAGMSAASIARRRDPELDVVAFERGPYTSYSACGIPYFVGGVVEDARRLISRSPDEHRRRGIDVRTRTEVVAIDLAARMLTVRSADGGNESREPFDELVVTTGAEPLLPDVPGAEAIEPARTVDAGERLRAALERGGTCAVVIGAGYIGLEMAEAFAHRGLNVTMIDQAPQVMGTLDADMAAHVQAAAERQGIRVVLGAAIDEIVTDAAGAPVQVRAAGSSYPADHVVIGTGARPAVALAAAAGLELGAGGALRVDDHQRCPGHDGVFAAGDCAESHHRVLDRQVNIQLGTHANKQGRIAGVNATGGDARFPGVIGTAVSKICRCEVARTGISEREAAKAGIEVVSATIEDRTRAGYYPGAGPIWVKLVAEPGSGRLLGGQIVGVEGAAKRIDVLATAIWTQLAVDELALLDLSYAPPFSGVYDPLLIAAREVAKLV